MSYGLTAPLLHLLPASLNWLHVFCVHWPSFSSASFFSFSFTLKLWRGPSWDHTGCCLFLAFLLIRAIVVCCILIMQDSPVKFQILPATVFHLISQFPVILEFPEITCICAALKPGESQQWMTSETLRSCFCSLDHFLQDDRRHILDDGFCSVFCISALFLLYSRDCTFRYSCTLGCNCYVGDTLSLPCMW